MLNIVADTNRGAWPSLSDPSLPLENQLALLYCTVIGRQGDHVTQVRPIRVLPGNFCLGTVGKICQVSGHGVRLMGVDLVFLVARVCLVEKSIRKN